jgi:flagellar hook assembly protein FlgD
MWAAPNPASGAARIGFVLPERQHVKVGVYNVAGRLVSTLVNAPAEPGKHVVTWNGLDDRGQKVPSGVYLLVMRGDTVRASAKFLNYPVTPRHP